MTRTTYDPDSDVSLVSTIVEAVADETGTNPLDMRPIYHVVDVGSLERLFPSDEGTTRHDPDREVRFRFEGCDVRVLADGYIVVTETERE